MQIQQGITLENKDNDDKSFYAKSMAKAAGVICRFLRIMPYGLASNPPPGSWVTLFGSCSGNNVFYGFESEFKDRKRELKPGEVCLFNPLTGAQVYLKENGGIDLNTANVTIEVTADGAVTINVPSGLKLEGNLTVNGTITGDEAIIGDIPFTTHLHPYAEIPMGKLTTEPPTIIAVPPPDNWEDIEI